MFLKREREKEIIWKTAANKKLSILNRSPYIKLLWITSCLIYIQWQKKKEEIKQIHLDNNSKGNLYNTLFFPLSF